MVSAIGAHRPAISPLPIRKDVPVAPMDDAHGKSGDSVGHMAKSAIAAAAPDDLLPNTQGKIASMIARHLDYSALLTAAEPPPPPVDEPPPVPAPGATGDTEPPPASGDVPADP